MRPTRLVEWTLVLASLSAVAINVWVTPRALAMPFNLARWVLFAAAAMLGLAAQTSKAAAVKIPWGTLPAAPPASAAPCRTSNCRSTR